MKISDIESLVRSNIRSLSPYSTARDEFKGDFGVFLDANESPFDSGFNRYPDPRQKNLKLRISELKGVPKSQIFLGNGSDEAIDVIFRVFCRPGLDNVIAISPSYGMYKVCADINDIEVREITLEEDFSLPTERLLSAADENTKIMFLCSPNNPTGNAFSVDQLETIIDNFNGIVVLDEAYIDFSEFPSFILKIAQFPNLIVLQTFSKAWGMASLRLGLAFSNEYIIKLMSMVKYPYNINSETQKIVLEALSKPIDENVKLIISERKRVIEQLNKYSFVQKVYPSNANFLLVKVLDANNLYNYLITKGIIVRNRTNTPLCGNCLRITIGLSEENDKLFKFLLEYEESNICR